MAQPTVLCLFSLATPLIYIYIYRPNCKQADSLRGGVAPPECCGLSYNFWRPPCAEGCRLFSRYRLHRRIRRVRRPKKIGAYRLGLRPRNHNSERDTESILQMIIKLDLQDAPTVGSNELRAETLFDQLIFFTPVVHIHRPYRVDFGSRKRCSFFAVSYLK